MRRTGDDEILRLVLKGDELAWTAFFSSYGPVVERIARASRSMGSYRRSVDDVRNVMAHVFERLRRDDFRALRTFPAWREKNPGKSFPDWLTIVTVNVVRNYVSSKIGATTTDGASLKQLVNTLAGAIDGDGPIVLPHITTKETAHRILEFARDKLAGDQLAVLVGWLEGASFDETARTMGLPDAKAAERVLRAALARLRRQFADQA